MQVQRRVFGQAEKSSTRFETRNLELTRLHERILELLISVEHGGEKNLAFLTLHKSIAQLVPASAVGPLAPKLPIVRRRSRHK